jgi:hypothetical protein
LETAAEGQTRERRREREVKKRGRESEGECVYDRQTNRDRVEKRENMRDWA